VDTLRTDGDGTNVDWSIGTGCTNEWECITDWPDDGSGSYLSANADALQQDATVSWAPSNLSSVDSVVIEIAHNETGAGTKVVAYGLISGGTTSYLDTLSSSSGTYVVYRGTPHTVDPNTSSAWTESAINALSVSFQSVSGHTSVRLSNVSGIAALVYWQQTATDNGAYRQNEKALGWRQNVKTVGGKQ